MEEALRVQKLEEIKQSSNPRMTGIRIPFQGDVCILNAYWIPLEYLIYNKYNGRIGSLVKSYERQNRPLNPEDPRDIAIIEEFLWESKPDRNNATMQSLVKDQQQQYGVVTDKGVIIDGNRRAFLLNKIYRERHKWEKHNIDHCRYFLAVILDAGADPREISKLETIYQMGQDAKLDYNPIEKYLKCKDLKDVYKFSFDDIAEMMGEKPSQIKEWYEIMQLMENYLSHLEYDGIYTRLEKREGPFVDLYRYLNKYKSGTSLVDWRYEDFDVADLEDVCFDYIRAQYEGKEFRYIAQTSKKESIFCRGDLWQDFLKDYRESTKTIKEPSVEEIREKNPDADLSDLLQARDSDWITKVKNELEGNLRKSIHRMYELNEENQPLALLIRARDALRAIDVNSDSFYNEAAHELLTEINKISHEYKKLIRRRHDSENSN